MFANTNLINAKNGNPSSRTCPRLLIKTVEKHMAEKHKADQDDSRNNLLLCHKGKLFSNCKKFVTSLKTILNVFPAGTI